MTVKKRGDTYWMDVTINGERIRESLKTTDPKQAAELHDIRRAELWRTSQLKERPKKSWADACTRWELERAHKKSIKDDKDKIKALATALGAKKLSEIDRDMIEAALPTDVKPATRNRYRALIRAILRACEREWDWLERAPVLRVEREASRRVSFLTRPQAEALIAAAPERHRMLLRMAILTGLRKANLYGLCWEDINLERGTAIVHGDEAKAGRRIVVPLNTAAKALLEALDGPRTGNVWGGLKPMKTLTWERLLKRAGIPEGFRFHDLRHTWATWHAMAGTPIQVLQELGGWQTSQMVRRYAHIADDHLARAAESVSL
jgi:integrase